jgi:hypothetical protein
MGLWYTYDCEFPTHMNFYQGVKESLPSSLYVYVGNKGCQHKQLLASK